MTKNPIIKIHLLGFMWPVKDPFLFCAHHLDHFPAGTPAMGPPPDSLRGRNIGQDFTLKDGWRMYHGDTIPGFPAHPHRGFETITIVMTGMVDHADSHGQAGRYGNGDVQWMTAGAGLQHSEMFPLLNQEAGNPAELFQVWLNLPAVKKFADPYYKMLWNEDIPVHTMQDASGKKVTIRIVAGELDGITPPAPAPDSWAASPENDVAVWTIRMEPGARWALPRTLENSTRFLHYYRGTTLEIGGTTVKSGQSAELHTGVETVIENGASESYLLLLQGKPIGEPVEQYGPFVMNTQAEIRQAFDDYRKTVFGGWPWPRRDVVHPGSRGRFALYGDGREEVKSEK